ncbi:MAG: hypothetical protein JWM11_1772, partial [Planctomycetaceae bacterium]|nr:hypothetical protein [Planctomycetaceae bacterium]
MHQLYHTTCSDGRGIKRTSGFGVLAASCSTEREIPSEVKEIAPYPFMLIRAGSELPARWVWQKTANGTSLLMRCVYLGAELGSGVGTHFSHILFDIPPDKGLREILGACTFPSWKQAYAGPPTLSTVCNLPPGSICTESQVSTQLQDPERKRVLTVAVGLCLYDGSVGGWNQILLPAEDDAVFNLLQLLDKVLPTRISSKLTFSTLEQKEGIGTRIIGIPRDVLKSTNSSQSAVSLLEPEILWDQLPQYAQDYAVWCLNCAAADEWDEIHRFLCLANQCGVESAAQLRMIWRLCKAPERLESDEISQLLNDRDLGPMVLTNAQFLSRARQVALSDSLDWQLLRRLHRHEKSLRLSRKTSVEEALIEAAVLAAELDQPTRLREVLELLSSFHRVSSDNLEYAFLSPDFGDRVREILRRLNQQMLDDPARQTPTLSYRLELFTCGRIWLAEEFQRCSMDHWLATENADECLALVEFLQHDRQTDASNGLIVRVLARFFQQLNHDLADDTRLLEWLWSCPAHILAQALTLVDVSQAGRLSGIWHGAAFRKAEFFSALVNREHSPHFESAYDIARVELVPFTVQHSIRHGDRTGLERDPGILEADILRFTKVELQRELSQPGDRFDIQAANHISQVACANYSRPFSEVVYSLNLTWHSLSPQAAAWILNRLFAEEDFDEKRPNEWISELTDAALIGLLNARHERVRLIATFHCLQRELTLESSHLELRTFGSLLERIAQKISSGHGSTEAAAASRSVKGIIGGLIRCSLAEFLVQPEIMDLIIWHASVRMEFLPLLESVLTKVPEETLVNQLRIPERKIQWDNALRVVEQDYERTASTIWIFVSKLIYVEMCNPWFRMSNSAKLNQHVDYPQHNDTLTRRMTVARFLVSEDGDDVPSFTDLLLTLQQEASHFQDAFFRALRQSG